MPSNHMTRTTNEIRKALGISPDELTSQPGPKVRWSVQDKREGWQFHLQHKSLHWGFSNFNEYLNHWRSYLNIDSDSVGLGALRLCISEKLPGNATSPRITL